jgi:integrase
MASIANDPNGYRRVQFVSPDGKRKSIRLGKVSLKVAESIRHRVESLLSGCITGVSDRDTSIWLAEITERNPDLRTKFEAVGLVEPLEPVVVDQTTLDEHVADFIKRVGSNRKPGTVAVWKQVQSELSKFMPKGILLADVTKGHAKQFHETLKKRGLASLTVVKHVRISKQFLEDAVEWEKITSNPFDKIKLSASIPKSNVEVSRESIDSLMPTMDTTWQLIVALSRFGGLRCPSETLSLRWADIDWERSRMAITEPKVEHHEGRGIRSCPIFPELMPYLQAAWDIAPEGAEFVVDKPAYRLAANTGTGWKNANLRTQFIKQLRKAGIAPWGRLFHSMRASRQTELERLFPLHVVCTWLGNSPKVANRSYLLTTDDDFAKAIATCGAESGAVEAKIGAKSGAVGSRTEPHSQEGQPMKTLDLCEKTKENEGEISGWGGIRTHGRETLLRFSRPVH